MQPVFLYSLLRMMTHRVPFLSAVVGLLTLLPGCLPVTGSPAAVQGEEKIVKPGVPEAQVAITKLKPSATFPLGGHPDWMAVTADAVWVSNSALKAVQRIDPATNRVVATIRFPAPPCSGLVFSFGSLWVPLCGKPSSLARVDARTNQIIATLRTGPADSEGGITSSRDSIWIVTNRTGSSSSTATGTKARTKQQTLVRIERRKNTVSQRISIPQGSFNPLFDRGVIWITGFDSNRLVAVNATTGHLLATVPVGPKPRFLTAGAGSIWTLNQGDGTVTRVDARSKHVLATIKTGSPGTGGEICYGASSIWTTVFDLPLTLIDAKSNTVLHQWTGLGGDSVRFGHHSIWLTDYHRGLLWRIPESQVLQAGPPGT